MRCLRFYTLKTPAACHVDHRQQPHGATSGIAECTTAYPCEKRPDFVPNYYSFLLAKPQHFPESGHVQKTWVQKTFLNLNSGFLKVTGLGKGL